MTLMRSVTDESLKGEDVKSNLILIIFFRVRIKTSELSKMWSSMPKDEFERLSDLKKEHEQIDLLILQEQTRTRFIKDAQAKAEAKRKLLDREIVMAGDLLDSAKSQRSLLLEYQIQLTETQRYSKFTFYPNNLT
jgi:hypothetical protein